jgi:lysophospholipase L1-like esterase
LVLGDSVAWTLTFGLWAHQTERGVYIAGNMALGCGISRLKYGTPIMFRGQKVRPSACTDVLPGWAADIDKWQPDVVALLVGHLEVSDREYAGRMRRPGDPVLDAYLRSELDRVLQAITARGVNVALLTSPYFNGGRGPDGGRWPEEEPARVDAFNRMLRRAAARNAGRVRIIDLNREVSRQGDFVARLHGVQVRSTDGVHFTPEGADLLSGSLLDELEELGRAHRDARVKAALTARSTRAPGTHPTPPGP